MREHLTAYNPATQERIDALAQGFGGGDVPQAVLALKLQVQAMILSFRDGFIRAAFVFVLGLVLIVMLKRTQSRGRFGAGH